LRLAATTASDLASRRALDGFRRGTRASDRSERGQRSSLIVESESCVFEMPIEFRLAAGRSCCLRSLIQFSELAQTWIGADT
jgi:hypothetical protein